jgi:hypothetical protein
MNDNRRGLVFPALILAVGLLGACGDDDDDQQQQQPPPPPPAGSRLWVVPDDAAALSSAQRADFTAGNLYANAHTSANAAGEIRGQLDQGGTLRLAVLDGDQEAPNPVTTNAFGAGALAVDEATGAVSGFIITSGLASPTAAHVHVGARGTPGDIVVPLTGGPDLWVVPDDAAALTPAQVAAFLAGNLYFNAHTTANPNGEIRGQIDGSGTVRLASLNGAQETPAVPTAAYGAGMLSVDDGTGAVAGFIITSGLDAPTAAHVHEAARGTPGDIRVPLMGGPSLWVVPDDAPPLAAAQRTAFTEGNLYVNAHTTAYPSGAIRGQLDRTGAVRLAAMDGAQETPAVTTTGFGAAAFAVDPANGQVSGFFATAGLASPTVAHVHTGARGTPGGILVPLAP